MVAESSVPRPIKDVILDADFICAVIPGGAIASNVYFELGVAVGTDRPRLLIVEPKADLPVALREEPYARAALSNASALHFHLDAFLKHGGNRGGERESGRREPDGEQDSAFIAFALERLAAWEAEISPPQEHDLVQFLADVFEAAGYITSTGPTLIGHREIRPDLAVWIDELQPTIGNPLLIEVTVQRTPISLNNVQQLQHMLSDCQSPLGLMVFWRPDTVHIREFWRQPMVVAMGARELVEAIGRGDFARTLLARRNAVVHSAA